MDPTSIDTALAKSAMENALGMLGVAGINDPGPIMKAYMDSLGIARAAVTPPPYVYPPTPSIKHLGRPKVKS